MMNTATLNKEESQFTLIDVTFCEGVEELLNEISSFNKKILEDKIEKSAKRSEEEDKRLDLEIKISKEDYIERARARYNSEYEEIDRSITKVSTSDGYSFIYDKPKEILFDNRIKQKSISNISIKSKYYSGLLLEIDFWGESPFISRYRIRLDGPSDGVLRFDNDLIRITDGTNARTRILYSLGSLTIGYPAIILSLILTSYTFRNIVLGNDVLYKYSDALNLITFVVIFISAISIIWHFTRSYFIPTIEIKFPNRSNMLNYEKRRKLLVVFGSFVLAGTSLLFSLIS